MAKTIAELSGLCDVLSNRLETAPQEVTDLWASHERQAEQLQAAREEAARSNEQAVHTRRELDRADARIESFQAELAAASQENAVLRQRFDDHLKRVETWSARLWALVSILIGAVLSLASGLIVTLVRK